MLDIQPIAPIQPKPNPNRRRDILLIVFSCIGILGLLIRGTYLAVTGLLSFDPSYLSSLAANLLDALAMLFCAGLLLPILIFSIKHMQEKVIPPAGNRPVEFWEVLMLGFIWIVVVVLGAVLNSLFAYGWAAAAPFFLLGISLPILCLAWIGAGGLPGGSRRRLWSVFGFGMVGGTFAALVLEYLVLAIGLVGIGILVVSNPGLRSIFDQIKNQVMNSNAVDLQSLLVLLAPYITNPLIILSVIVFAAVLTPLIEETAKPAIIWFIGKNLRSPAEGFLLGALCGAGFSMLEGLMSASNSTQMWGFALAGRAAASLMHITSSGILGWGIASARLEKRYGRLALTYLLSITIHGLWNGSAIMAVYGALRIMVNNSQFDFLSILFIFAGAGILFIELISLLTALPTINHRLRRSVSSIPVQVQSDIIAPPTTSDSRETNGLDS